MFFGLNHRIIAQVLFMCGLLLMAIGSAFLLGNILGISQVSILLSFLLVLAGSGSAVLAIRLNKRSIYLFFAAFFIFFGVFLFLSSLQILSINLREWWPLISVFAGLALIPTGWYSYGMFRVRFIVPAIVFLLLGISLLVFSLKIVSFSFKQFILSWWPLLIALAGLLLVLLSLGTKNNRG